MTKTILKTIALFWGLTFLVGCRTHKPDAKTTAIEDIRRLEARQDQTETLFDIICKDGRRETMVTEFAVRHNLICKRITDRNLECPYGRAYLQKRNDLLLTAKDLPHAHSLEYKLTEPFGNNYYGAIVMEFSSRELLRAAKSHFEANRVRAVCVPKITNSFNSQGMASVGFVDLFRTDSRDWLRLSENSFPGPCRNHETWYSILENSHPLIIESESGNILSVVKEGRSSKSYFSGRLEFLEPALRNEIQGHLAADELASHCVEGQISQFAEDGVIFIHRLGTDQAKPEAFQSR
jgi:hypothetical protein